LISRVIPEKDTKRLVYTPWGLLQQVRAHVPKKTCWRDPG